MKVQIGRDTFLQSLHHSRKTRLKNLAVYAEQGIDCQSEDGFSAHFYSAVGPYIADLPETEDVLSFQ